MHIMFSKFVLNMLKIAETNEIPDDTYNGKTIAVSPVATNPQCILCEFIMKEIDDQLKNKKNEVLIMAGYLVFHYSYI